LTLDRQTLAAQQAEETKILSKVRGVQRDAFEYRYPTQVTHCLRLTMERLQYGLDKRGGIDVSNPDTWNITTEEIADLAKTAYYLDQIRRGF